MLGVRFRFLILGFCLLSSAGHPFTCEEALSNLSQPGRALRVTLEHAVPSSQVEEATAVIASWQGSLSPTQESLANQILGSLRYSSIEELKLNLKAASRALESNNPASFSQHLEILKDRELSKTPEKTVARAMAAIDAAKDPYGNGFYLKYTGNPSDQFERAKEILHLQRIIDSQANPLDTAKKVSQWVKSPAHALYLYDNLEKFSDRAGVVLKHLLQHNEFFEDVGRVRGPPRTLITLSFEKETTNLAATAYYKDPRYSDEAWMELPEETRSGILRRINGSRGKTFLPANEVAPTLFKPHSLGGYGQELSNMGFLMEFSHRKFEISPKQVVSELKQISSDLKSTEAIHVHLVFDLPKRYEKMVEFSHYLKQVNDHLYLAGMEEGLHGNFLVGLPKTPRPALHPASFFDPGLFLFGRTSFLPRRPNQVEFQSHKFFSAALRATIYGESKDPKFQKLGIELRDATRNIGTLENHISNISRGLQERTWESFDSEQKGLQITPDRGESMRLLMKAGLDRTTARKLVAQEPLAALPLQPFETAQYRDYRSGGLFQASPAKAKAISEARQQYIQELHSFQKDLRNQKEAGERVEGEIIQAVARMNLTGWARSARVSELFSRY